MRKPRMLAVGAAVLALTLSACQPGGSGSPSASQSSGSPSTPAELPTVIIGSADFDEAVGKICFQHGRPLNEEPEAVGSRG